jgi:hypothetical protein
LIAASAQCSFLLDAIRPISSPSLLANSLIHRKNDFGGFAGQMLAAASGKAKIKQPS